MDTDVAVSPREEEQQDESAPMESRMECLEEVVARILLLRLLVEDDFDPRRLDCDFLLPRDSSLPPPPLLLVLRELLAPDLTDRLAM